MRFSEFTLINEAEQSKYYTVGDSHAIAIAAAGGWPTTGKAGSKSSDPIHKTAIDRIPAGSVVVISLGHNDSTGTTDSPEQIANQITSLINYSLKKGQHPTFILFPRGTAKNAKRNENVRSEINSQVSVPKFDLNDADLVDGIHATASDYKQIAEAVRNFVKPTKAVAQVANTRSQRSIASPNSRVRKGNHAPFANYLKSKGMDDNHSSGILTNIEAESSFNPAAYIIDSNGLPSGGLFQHNGTRFKNMVNAVGRNWKTNWQGQIDFALSEPKAQEYLQKSFSSPEAASEWWTVNFEVPQDKFRVAQERSKNASSFT